MDPRFPTPALRVVCALCAASLLGVTGPAIAQESAAGAAPPQAAVSAEALRIAEEHLARGLELYKQKHYTEAVAEFRAGYLVNGDVRLLYALAQSLRLAGQCTEAVNHYQRFLESAPGPAQEEAARANLERCRQQATSTNGEGSRDVAPKPATTPPSAPVGTPPAQPPVHHPIQPDASVTPAPPDTHSTPAWYTDPLGASLTGGGLLGVGAGVALLVVGNSKRIESRRLEDGATPGTYQQHTDRVEAGEMQLLSGGILAAVGLTTMTLGMLRYHSVASRRSVSLALTVLPTQTTASFGGTF